MRRTRVGVADGYARNYREKYFRKLDNYGGFTVRNAQWTRCFLRRRFDGHWLYSRPIRDRAANYNADRGQQGNGARRNRFETITDVEPPRRPIRVSTTLGKRFRAAYP